MIHEINIHTEQFNLIVERTKTVDILKNDWQHCVGDFIKYREYLNEDHFLG